jgi:hypothetical protein
MHAVVSALHPATYELPAVTPRLVRPLAFTRLRQPGGPIRIKAEASRVRVADREQDRTAESGAIASVAKGVVPLRRV